jgi:hypothetical protein
VIHFPEETRGDGAGLQKRGGFRFLVNLGKTARALGDRSYSLLKFFMPKNLDLKKAKPTKAPPENHPKTATSQRYRNRAMQDSNLGPLHPPKQEDQAKRYN